jgi:lysozyme
MDKFMSSLTAMLKRHEGLSLEMYTDTVGVPTLGYGHNLNCPISLEAASHILEDDIYLAMTELDRHKPFWRMLPFNARLVVLNMAFNLGWPRLRDFVRFWTALEFNNWVLAAQEMRDSRWYVQVGRRSVELAELMERTTTDGPTEI